MTKIRSNDPAVQEELPAGSAALVKLMQEFMNGGFACGEQLRETKIAAKFGLSRAAVREALNQMVNMDIMEYVPYCGYRLREYTLWDILEWYELREAIEPMAARRLAQYRPLPVLKELEKILEQEAEATRSGDRRKAHIYDHDFHLTLVGECGNRRFGNFYCQSSVAVLAQMTGSAGGEIADALSANLSLKNNGKLAERGFRNSHEWHQMIFDYICEGDVDKAEKTMREHISYLIEKIRNYLIGREARRTQPDGGGRPDVSISNIIKANTKIILTHYEAAARRG